MSTFDPFQWPGDGIFDLNGDGELDTFERAARDVHHMQMMGLLDDDDNDDDEYDYDDYDDDDIDDDDEF